MDCISTNKNNPDLDLTIFKDIDPSSTSTTTKTNCNSYLGCSAIQRLILSLSYFTKLNIFNNINNRDIFSDFMYSVYSQQIHNDIFHLIKHHQGNLEDIYQNLLISKYNFTPCNLESCKNSNRHYRVNNTDEKSNISNKDNKYLPLYIETMDSLHFLLFHLYDSSLRISNSYKQSALSEDNSDHFKNEYYDRDFSRILQSMQKTRKSTNRFSRLTTSKFNISGVIDQKYDDDDEIDVGDDCDTFLDDTYDKLLAFDNPDSAQFVSKLKEIISDQEYDTEALDIDLQLFIRDGKSNISSEINNDSFMNEIDKIFNAAKGIFYFIYFYFVFSLLFFFIFFYFVLFLAFV